MDSYEGVRYVLHVLSIISIILYFVTTADSASLVTDTLSSNGENNTPALQRGFWAVTQGAMATALLLAGGEQALQALQAGSVAAGFPFTILICILFVSMWRALKLDSGEMPADGAKLNPSLIHTFLSPIGACKCCLATIAPWYYIGIANRKLVKSKGYLQMTILVILFYSAILLVILESVVVNIGYLGLISYCLFSIYASNMRSGIRHHSSIHGNFVEDFFAIFLLYPLSSVQMFEHSRFMTDSTDANNEDNHVDSHDQELQERQMLQNT